MPTGIYKRKPLTEEHKKHISEGKKGKSFVHSGSFKKGHKPIGEYYIKGYEGLKSEKNGFWKGDKVGYNGLHCWVNRHLGKPDICEFCGKTGLSGHQIVWANIDHTYKRNLKDWIRLCAKCHKKYDKDNGFKINQWKNFSSSFNGG